MRQKSHYFQSTMLAVLCSRWHQILLILLILLLFFVWYVSLVMRKEEEIIVVAVSWLLKSWAHLNKSVVGEKMPWTLIIQQWIKNVDGTLMQRGKWCARVASPENKADSLTKVLFPPLWSNRLEHLCIQLVKVLDMFCISLCASSHPAPHPTPRSFI